MSDLTKIIDGLETISAVVSDYHDRTEDALLRLQAQTILLHKQMQMASVPPAPRERLVWVSPAWDRRSAEASRNYGWHGMELHWILRGPKGAVEWTVGTNWTVHAMVAELQSWDDAWLKNSQGQSPQQSLRVHAYVRQPAHSRVLCHHACKVLGNDWCYFVEVRPWGESEVPARELYWILVESGEAAFWQQMQVYYDALVGPEDDGDTSLGGNLGE